MNYALCIKQLSAEHEIDCAEKTKSCPHEVPLEWLSHEYHSKWNEYAERDDLLNDFELWQCVHGETYAIGWHHDDILAECDAPTNEGCDIPSF